MDTQKLNRSSVSRISTYGSPNFNIRTFLNVNSSKRNDSNERPTSIQQLARCISPQLAKTNYLKRRMQSRNQNQSSLHSSLQQSSMEGQNTQMQSFFGPPQESVNTTNNNSVESIQYDRMITIEDFKDIALSPGRKHGHKRNLHQSSVEQDGICLKPNQFVPATKHLTITLSRPKTSIYKSQMPKQIQNQSVTNSKESMQFRKSQIKLNHQSQAKYYHTQTGFTAKMTIPYPKLITDPSQEPYMCGKDGLSETQMTEQKGQEQQKETLDSEYMRIDSSRTQRGFDLKLHNSITSHKIKNTRGSRGQSPKTKNMCLSQTVLDPHQDDASTQDYLGYKNQSHLRYNQTHAQSKMSSFSPSKQYMKTETSCSPTQQYEGSKIIIGLKKPKMRHSYLSPTSLQKLLPQSDINWDQAQNQKKTQKAAYQSIMKKLALKQ